MGLYCLSSSASEKKSTYWIDLGEVTLKTVCC